jgi:hypothetical protein
MTGLLFLKGVLFTGLSHKGLEGKMPYMKLQKTRAHAEVQANYSCSSSFHFGIHLRNPGQNCEGALSVTRSCHGCRT